MRLHLVFFFSMFASLCSAQVNLVPNPSFEDYTSCPTFASQLERAVPWFNPNLGTPEYYNACATPSSYMSLPSGTSGHFQYPRTGNGFAGLYTFRTDVNSMREYIEVELLDELEAGKCYYLEFFVNAPNNFPYASDGIGAYVSEGEITAGNANPLSATPQIENPSGNIISDTLGWTKVSGYFTANGGENHLIIGNFRSDSETNWTEFNPGVWYEQSSYLYVDDVLLRLHDFSVELGEDTSLCEDEFIELNATTTDATYLWDNGSASAVRAVQHQGEYWVEVVLDGCRASDTVIVSYNPIPTMNLGDDLTFCETTEVELVANSNVNELVWQDGTTDTVYVTDEPGIYWVTASNECGVVTDTLTIELKECSCNVYIPSAFSPNNDGLNDAFGIEYNCDFEEFDMRIFDRWGNLVFITNNPDFIWTPEPSSLNVYTYQLRFSSSEVDTGKGLKIGKIVLVK